MKMKILGIFTIILIICAIICGVWMKMNPGEGSVNFHAGLSIGAMVFSLLTIIIFMAIQ